MDKELAYSEETADIVNVADIPNQVAELTSNGIKGAKEESDNLNNEVNGGYPFISSGQQIIQHNGADDNVALEGRKQCGSTGLLEAGPSQRKLNRNTAGQFCNKELYISTTQKFIAQLREDCKLETTVEREECKQNEPRLGRFLSQQVGNNCQKVFKDGTAFEEIKYREEMIQAEIQELSQRKKQMIKKWPTEFRQKRKTDESIRSGLSSTEEQSQLLPNGDGGRAVLRIYSAGRGLSDRTAASVNISGCGDNNENTGATLLKPNPTNKSHNTENYFEWKNMLKRHDDLKKAAADLQLEQENLEHERLIHISKLNRISHEDKSPFNDQPVINDRYLLLKMLGKGGFAEVFKAFDLNLHRYVACKIHCPRSDCSENQKTVQFENALNEFALHRGLEHPCIVKLLDAFEIEGDSFCMAVEYCDGIDLNYYLKKEKTIPESAAKSIITQIVSALKYLNQIKPPVIHFDIKPGNILLTGSNISGDIKIVDFGLSKSYNPFRGFVLPRQRDGTPWYLPPECFATKPATRVSSKVDVWSVGITFYECLYGKIPFGQRQSRSELLQKKTVFEATEVEFTEIPSVSKEAKEFIRDCLTHLQDKRMDVFAMADHQYMQPSTPAEGNNQSLKQQEELPSTSRGTSAEPTHSS